MATYVNPFSWAAVETAGELAQTWHVKATMALMRLAETMNPMEMGLLAVLGTIGGSDSDTLRIPDMTNLGGQALTALASETDVPANISMVLGYTDATVAWYGGAREQTYGQQVFSGELVNNALSVEAFLDSLPLMVAKTIRGLAATAGAGISGSVGSSTYRTSYDTLLALAALWNASAYSAPFPGLPKAMIHSTQWEHIKDSVRVEPGFQMNGLATGVQGLEQSQFHADPLGLGMDIVTSADVLTSASAFQGFVTDPGGIGVCFGDTSRIRTAANVPSLALPQVGMHWQEITDGARQATRTGQVRQIVGVTVGSSNVYRQYKILGKTT